MQVFPKRLLRVVVQRIRNWADSTLTVLADPPPESSLSVAAFEDEFLQNRPPAHWLERVRQATPELLQPGEPMRVRPADLVEPIEPVCPSRPSQTLDSQQEEFQAATPRPSIAPTSEPVRLRLITQSSQGDRASRLSAPLSSGSTVNPDAVSEQSPDQSSKLPAENLTQHDSSWNCSTANSASITPAVPQPKPPLRLKPLPLKFTAFSNLEKAAPSASPAIQRREEAKPSELPLIEDESDIRPRITHSSKPQIVSEPPSSKGKSNFIESTLIVQKKPLSVSIDQLQLPSVHQRFESPLDPFFQPVRAFERSAFEDNSIPQPQQIHSSEKAAEDFFFEHSINASDRWIDLPDPASSESEDKSWDFILGDRDHLQRLLKEQQSGDRL